VRDLEALLGELRLGAALTLVMHDWGGMIGMTFAARHPERIARLIVLNTAAFHLPPSKPLPWQLRLARMRPLGEWLVRGLNGFVRGTLSVACKKKRLSVPIRAAYLAPYDSWANRIAVYRFVEDIPLRPGDRSYDLVTFTQAHLGLFSNRPMLIGWGMRDFVFDRTMLAEWQQRFPRAEVHRFADAGHFVLEDEAERLVPLVQGFLATHPATRRVG
jgi:haloalkane dehalogenase